MLMMDLTLLLREFEEQVDLATTVTKTMSGGLIRRKTLTFRVAIQATPAAAMALASPPVWNTCFSWSDNGKTGFLQNRMGRAISVAPSRRFVQSAEESARSEDTSCELSVNEAEADRAD